MEIEVLTQQDFSTGELQVFIRVRYGDGSMSVAKPVNLVFERVEPGIRVVDPTLRISRDLAPKFLKALAECMDKEGIKTENDHKIQGLLEATKLHLKDMRELVRGNHTMLKDKADDT